MEGGDFERIRAVYVCPQGRSGHRIVTLLAVVPERPRNFLAVLDVRTQKIEIYMQHR